MRSHARIAINLLRMASGFLLGLVFVRLLLHFGPDAAGVVLLLGTGLGIGTTAQQWLEMSLTPLLGLACNAKEPAKIRASFSEAVLASLAVSALVALTYGTLLLGVHVLSIPPALLDASRWFLAAKAAQSLASTLLAPYVAACLVQGRMWTYNFNMLSERAADVVAIIATLALGFSDPSACLISYALLSAAGRLACLLLVTASALRASPQFRWPRGADERPSWRNAMGCLRDNLQVVVGNTLYLRLDQLFINLSSGVLANLVFAVAAQLVAYVRLLTHGQAIGIEANAARLIASTPSRPESLAPLVQQSSRQQAVLVLPAVVLLAVLGDPILRLWLGPVFSDLQAGAASLSAVFLLLLTGMTARSLTEGWMRILNGAGHVRAYAWPTLVGACLNAVLAGLAALVLRDDHALIAIAGLYAALQAAVHLVWVPLRMSRFLDVSIAQLAEPLVRPALVSAASSVPLWFYARQGQSEIAPLVALVLAFLTLYASATFLIVLSPGQRREVLGLLAKLRSRRSQLGASAPQAIQSPDSRKAA